VCDSPRRAGPCTRAAQGLCHAQAPTPLQRGHGRLIVGIPRGVWHLLQDLWVSETYAGLIPLAIYLPLNFFSALPELTALRYCKSFRLFWEHLVERTYLLDACG
jgi:hypothetical protein